MKIVITMGFKGKFTDDAKEMYAYELIQDIEDNVSEVGCVNCVGNDIEGNHGYLIKKIEVVK
jgi:hypothetical protein